MLKNRRTVYSLLLNFLKNPNKESDFDRDLNLTLIKYELKALTLRFVKGPAYEGNPTCITKMLFECKSPTKSINRVAKLDTQLSKEIDLFTSGGGRDEN